MAFEFIQIPANGQGSAKEELNKLLRNGRIASVKNEFVSNGEDSFWAFCIEFLDGALLGLLNLGFSLGVSQGGARPPGPTGFVAECREWFFPAVNAGIMTWRVTILQPNPAPSIRCAAPSVPSPNSISASCLCFPQHHLT